MRTDCTSIRLAVEAVADAPPGDAALDAFAGDDDEVPAAAGLVAELVFALAESLDAGALADAEFVAVPVLAVDAELVDPVFAGAAELAAVPLVPVMPAARRPVTST
jgi:hypothetical protein